MKRLTLKTNVLGVLYPSRVSVRTVASIVRQLLSMSLALGPISRLRTRALYADINRCTSWNAFLSLSESAKEELVFGKAILLVLTDSPYGLNLVQPASFILMLYSNSGYGGYSVEVGPQIAHGVWTKDEACLSSTWRELKAVYRVLCSLAPMLKGHSVKWFSDNQNVTRIVHTGSRKQHLQDDAMATFEVCFQHGIKLEMEWIPRAQNHVADYISRIQDFDDWMFDPNMFLWVDMAWGPHTVDCFAAAYNHQLPRFHSGFWCPDTDGTLVRWRS